ncbi:MAG: hypothetical protein IT438_13005 [Phycisphaerales bacterium]|nr:hypothetical protein [Phycisphaerales bacterium]
MALQDQRSGVVALRLHNAGVAEPRRAPRRPVVVDAPSWRVTADCPPKPAKTAIEGDDPRWLLARRAFEQLQGGTAAILPPESRTRLNTVGRRLGLRAFDISLVIAIVQDHARTASTSTNTNDAWATLQSRLRMVPTTATPTSCAKPTPDATRTVASFLPYALATLAIAAAMIALAAAWITR